MFYLGESKQKCYHHWQTVMKMAQVHTGCILKDIFTFEDLMVNSYASFRKTNLVCLCNHFIAQCVGNVPANDFQGDKCHSTNTKFRWKPYNEVFGTMIELLDKIDCFSVCKIYTSCLAPLKHYVDVFFSLEVACNRRFRFSNDESNGVFRLRRLGQKRTRIQIS